ncbi:MAG: helix-turn-helix domain-containing protein [bacterium]|nr:helix-turn-helix domain-containing protein [bacterium]
MKKQQPKLKELPDILTLQQACKALNCHPNTLRGWDNRGILKAVRFGSRRDRRYKKTDIIKFISGNRQK